MLNLWLITVAMLAVALAVILFAMFGGRQTRLSNRTKQNVMLAKARLQELEQDRNNGLLDDDAYSEAKQDIERALLQDVTGDSDEAQTEVQLMSKSSLYIASGIAFLLPAVTVTLYLLLGSPAALKNSTPQQQLAGTNNVETEQHSNDEMLAMIAKLAQRLRDDPKNSEGWDLLARSYMSMKMYAQATDALQKLYALVGDDVEVLVRLADATAMVSDARFEGEAITLINKALAIQPDHPTALWLAGMAAQEKQQWSKAVDYWQRAKAVLVNNPQSQVELDRLIQYAQTATTGSGTESMASASGTESRNSQTEMSKGVGITVTVSLGEKYKKSLDKNTTVFILAQAIKGPPMPLAAVKKRVADLPITITLDDSMAMMPSHKISKYQQVRIIARVSKSGSARAQPGDIQGLQEPVDSNANIKLVINEQL